MAEPVSDSDGHRLREELGFQRWEAIRHFLTEGDYLGLNQGDHRGAIAEYEKAWELLSTPWQRETGGADILEGIADIACRSDDADLAREALGDLRPRAARIESVSLEAALEKLAQLEGQR